MTHGHRAAVGHQPIDEFQPARLGNQRLVSLVESYEVGFRQRRETAVNHVVSVHGDDAETPSGRTEKF